MTFVVRDRIKVTTTTTGTGTLTLGLAVVGFQDFTNIGNGNQTYYTITNGTDWETGIGTYTSSGTTLSRDTVLASSNSGALVDWAVSTAWMIRASTVLLPTAVATIVKEPDDTIVPPTTEPPSVRSTGRPSPVSIDSSILACP